MTSANGLVYIHTTYTSHTLVLAQQYGSRQITSYQYGRTPSQVSSSYHIRTCKLAFMQENLYSVLPTRLTQYNLKTCIYNDTSLHFTSLSGPNRHNARPSQLVGASSSSPVRRDALIHVGISPSRSPSCIHFRRNYLSRSDSTGSACFIVRILDWTMGGTRSYSRTMDSALSKPVLESIFAFDRITRPHQHVLFDAHIPRAKVTTPLSRYRWS